MIYIQLFPLVVRRIHGTFNSHIAAAEERGKRVVTLAALGKRHLAGVKSAATRARNLDKARKGAAYVAAADAEAEVFLRARNTANARTEAAMAGVEGVEWKVGTK